jgi:hypothetical protein
MTRVPSGQCGAVLEDVQISYRMEKIHIENINLEEVKEINFIFLYKEEFINLSIDVNFLKKQTFFSIKKEYFEFGENFKFKIKYLDDKVDVFDFIKNTKQINVDKPITLKHKIGSIVDSDESRILLLEEINDLIADTNNKNHSLIKSSKILVYIPVYFDTGYVDLLDLCLKSFYFNKTINFDVLIITDESTKKIIEKLNIVNFFNIHFLITETPENSVQASMNKYLVYDFEKIWDYEKIFLLDSDIICMKNSDILFNLKLASNQIYAVRQKSLTFQNFKNYYHGFPFLPDSFIKHVEKTDQTPFNAGQFLFLNSDVMKIHFENIKHFIKKWTGDFFYEQCFFNYYFCKAEMAMSRELDRFIALVCPTNNFRSNLVLDTRLIHFIGPSSNAKVKLEYIENFINKKKYASMFKT